MFAIGLHGGELVVCDKGYAGRGFEHTAAERYGARILRPARKNEPGRGVESWIGDPRTGLVDDNRDASWIGGAMAHQDRTPREIRPAGLSPAPPSRG
jgi:hypothetical protein